MAFDGITTKSVIHELQNCLIGGKINKVFNPTKNEVILNIYNKENYILLISANPDYCRIHLTTHTKPNPQNASNFCMLLRKYLIGAKITDVSTYDLERTVQIKFETFNEMNDLVIRKLFIPIMNRQSNIILTNENNIIIDSLKHSENHLPAHHFEFSTISKKSFLEISNFNDFKKDINSSSQLSCLASIYIGFSKTFVKNTLEFLEIPNTDYSDEDLKKLYKYLKNLLSNLEIGKISIKTFDTEYSVVNIENNDTNINYSLDEIYYEIEKEKAFISSRNNLLKIVSSHLKKVRKKLENINSKLTECSQMDTYRVYGEILTANLYKINQNENLSEITLENYYENNAEITIPLDNKINVQKNIEKFFKKYNKLKNALIIVTEQKNDAEKELDYIESIVFALENSRSIDDIVEVYTEISSNMFTKKEIYKSQKNKVSKKRKQTEAKIKLQSQEIEGFTVYVGKNNIQNDYLSLKFANKNDIWFHAQKIHGSHVLLTNPENKKIPHDALVQCATLAKENSKGCNSTNVPVDYCEAKFIKKPSGSKPGFVIYTHYKTIIVK